MGNLKGLGGSIFSSFKPVDIFFILPSILLLIYYFGFLKRRIVATDFRSRIKMFILLIFLSGSVIGWNLYSCRNNELNLLSEHHLFKYDVVNATWNYGFLIYWVWDIADGLDKDRTLTTQEKTFVDGWIADHKRNESNQAPKITNRKNIILIIVESLETFPIGKYIADNEITPNIDLLLKSENCFYAPYVLSQVKDGRSSDSQLIINSGMLPINSGAACFRYPESKYYTLSKALKGKGYSSHTLIGGEASYWNQKILNEDMGFDELISKENFRADEIYEFGLSDSSFLSQSIEKISNFSQPFFTQVITLSSHYPFNLPDHRIYLKVPGDCPPELARYINSIHYIDRYLGIFFSELRKNDLFENSIIVITGDHDAFNHEPYLEDKYGKKFLTKNEFIPLIVLNTDKKELYSHLLGQIDIYPTLIDLFGLNGYQWHGLGRSIYDKNKKELVVDAKQQVWGDLKNISKEDIIYAKTAWQVSNIIISKNYFLKSN